MATSVVFGAPGFSVLELTFLLNKLNCSYGVVTSSLTRVQGNKTLDRTPIVFSTPASYRTFFNRFKTPITGLVLGDPVTLEKEYSLPLIGVTSVGKSLRFIGFSEKELRSLLKTDFGDTPKPEVNYTPYSPIDSILKTYPSSELSTIQTQLYKIKDGQARDVVNREIRGYFTGKTTLTKLLVKIQDCAGVKTKDAFKDILSTEEMIRLKEAVVKVKASPTKLHTFAKKLKISPFDIKYLLAERS